MSGPPYSYPALLTNKQWQKNKGPVAKVAVGKTDVGAHLTELEAGFKASAFSKEQTAYSGTDPAGFTVYAKARQSELEKQARDIVAKAEVAARAALAAHGEMKTNRAVPASVAQCLKSMIDALDNLSADVKGYPATMMAELDSEFGKKVKSDSFVQHLLQAVPKIEAKWRALSTDIKAVADSPTVDTVGRIFHGDNNARGVWAATVYWDQIVATKVPATARKLLSGSARETYGTLPCLADLGAQSAPKVLQALIEKSGKSEEWVVTAYMLKFNASVTKLHEFIGLLKSVANIMQAV